MTDQPSAPETGKCTPWLLRLSPTPSEDPAGHPPKERDATATGRATGLPAPGLPADTLGLALSGGGIRSAVFSLGILQSLARTGWLRRVDLLSTVSGGGYIGAFLGKFFDLYKPGGRNGSVTNHAPGAAQQRVTEALSDTNSAPIRWLRQNANYLSPTGLGATLTNTAGFVRNLLSFYFVLFAFLFAAFGILIAVSNIELQGTAALLVQDLSTILTPVTTNLPEAWRGPWLVLAEAALWLTVVPLMLAYWLVSQDLFEAFIAQVLVVSAILAVALLVGTWSPLGIVVLAVAVLWAFEAWATVRRREGHADPLNPFRLVLARSHLTQRLAFWLAVTGGLAVMGLIDRLGRGLARQMVEGGLTAGNVLMWLTCLVTLVLGIATSLHLVARNLVARVPGVSSLWMVARPHLAALVLVLCGALPLAVAVSFASHAAFETGETKQQGLILTAVAVVVSFLLGSRACVVFVNRSSPLSIYASRLARTFLGAVNPERRVHPEGASSTQLIPGDDVPFDQYRPHAAGGPLHVINCALNETVDPASQRGLRDRQAENLALGPAGVSIAQRWHGLWTGGHSGLPALAPLTVEDRPHPLRGQKDQPVEVENLFLREWAAISGAALGSGMGRRTGLVRSLFLTLGNVRLGYWWNSGLNKDERRNVPVRRGLWPTLVAGFLRWFRAQSLLLAELTGRFGGPWYRYWYLSDGGNFEVTGAYELLRRRVPFIIVSDAGQDEDHRGTDLASLIRLARIDFGAEVREAESDPAVLQKLGVPPTVAAHLGTLAEVLASKGDTSRKHAALLQFIYGPRSGPPTTTAVDSWIQRRHTWLLYIKATVTGDESLDIRNYAAIHPAFPNESTVDQVFDEAQWESYRKLGEHIGDGLFA